MAKKDQRLRVSVVKVDSKMVGADKVMREIMLLSPLCSEHSRTHHHNEYRGTMTGALKMDAVPGSFVRSTGACDRLCLRKAAY